MFKVEIERINGEVKRYSGGSAYLGHGFVWVTFVDGITYTDGTKGDAKFGFPDLALRLTAAGEPRINFPSDLAKDKDGKQILDDRGQPKRYDRYFPGDAETRTAFTAVVFRDDAVIARVEQLNAISDREVAA